MGDTQDDNKNHGAIPAGGTLATNGLVSTKITLTAGAEPTASTTKTDDDTDANSDMTIDFAVTTPPAVPVSLGNFVWLDANSNGAVDGSEATAGINGVTVKLYASSADSNNNGSLSAAELAAATQDELAVLALDIHGRHIEMARCLITRNDATDSRRDDYIDFRHVYFFRHFLRQRLAEFRGDLGVHEHQRFLQEHRAAQS